MIREEAIECLNFQNEKLFGGQSEALKMAIKTLEQEPCREADDYKNEIADLHNRLDIAEYDKERYKEEITTLEAENKTLKVKLENAEDVLRGLKEDLEDARAELRERW